MTVLKDSGLETILVYIMNVHSINVLMFSQAAVIP